MSPEVIQLVCAAIIPALFAIAFHEAAHGWAARYFGDRTAEMLGRLSLNPIRHIDPFGTVLAPLLLAFMGLPPLGWAKPVPVVARNLRNPKRDMAVVAAAGPLSNLVMALGWALVLVLVGLLLPAGSGVWQFGSLMARFGIQFNVLLAVFNFLPIPPLDGGRVLRGLVSEPIGRRLDAIERYGLIIVLALLTFGNLGRILSPLIERVVRIILSLVGG